MVHMICIRDARPDGYRLSQPPACFFAGNSGLNTCTPFLPSYHTVLGGYQSAKNVISVGATNDSGAIASFSSRGPVKDGRIKPEIVSMGQFVASAWAGNYYGYNNGTSMAGPMVSGGLALLYQLPAAEWWRQSKEWFDESNHLQWCGRPG